MQLYNNPKEKSTTYLITQNWLIVYCAADKSSLTECNWEPMNQQLLHERKYPVAIMVPDHLVTCEQLDIYQVSNISFGLVYWKFTIGGVYCIVEPDEVLLNDLLEGCLGVCLRVCLGVC